MTSKEKKGVGLIVVFFIVLGIIMYFTMPESNGPKNTFEDNPLVNEMVERNNN